MGFETPTATKDPLNPLILLITHKVLTLGGVVEEDRQEFPIFEGMKSHQ